MSQRGLRLNGVPVFPTGRWAHIRTILFFVLVFTLGATLTLIAQDSPTVQPTAKQVTLQLDGTERQVSTFKETVQTLLHQEAVKLNPHDRCEPPIATPVTDGMTVTITRVSCELVKKRVVIPPTVVTRWDHRMSAAPVTVHEGKAGVMEETWVVWKKNGVVSEQWKQRSRVVVNPKPKVVVRGSAPSRSGMGARRVLTCVATAYDPGPLSCGPNATGRTATGMKATRGVIAVDPRVIPLGSRVYVDGYGYAIAADTGGAIKGNKIDVCFPSRRDALNWGRRTVRVVVLN